jgi:glycosyltransferase involved in cell wall biosynthesis
VSDSPSVSTIIVTYNHEKYIREAVNSALDQDYSGDHQVIVVDDCSTDGTSAVLAEYGERILRIRPEKNLGGAGWTRQLGQQYARGEWLAWLDGDDVWFDKKLANMIALATELGTNVVASDCVYIDQDSNYVGLKPAHPASGEYDQVYMLKADWQFPALEAKTNWLNSPSQLMVRRSVMEKIGPWIEMPASEDYDMLIRLAKAGEDMAMSCAPYTKFRLGSYGRSSEERRKLWEPTVEAVWQRHFGK